jgi:hypothetical protein
VLVWISQAVSTFSPQYFLVLPGEQAVARILSFAHRENSINSLKARGILALQGHNLELLFRFHGQGILRLAWNA